MNDKLRRSISIQADNIVFLLINGKIQHRTGNTVESALRIVKARPIGGPLAVWCTKPGLVCIGQLGAWKAVPVAYGRWDEMFPVFESYARMMEGG